MLIMNTVGGPLRAEDTPFVESKEEQALTGRELLDSCTASPSPESEPYRFCMVFMVGLVQTVTIMQQSGESPPLFCIDPKVVSPEAVRDEAVKWMQAHDTRLHEEAYLLVSEALHQAYPCRGDLSGAREPSASTVDNGHGS